jgi:predicted LPLAT superfamily acyltransferase
MKWTEQKSSKLKYSIVIFFYKILGYRITKLIIWFISSYYSIFFRSAVDSIKDYHLKVYKCTDYKKINKQFYTFAMTIFDSVLNNIGLERPVFEVEGDKEELNKSKRLVLSAHVGGWQVASNELALSGIPINIVVYEQTTSDVIKMIKKQDKVNLKKINFTDDFFSNIIKINSVISEGENIAMLADRFINIEHTVKVNFFNNETYINSVPFLISYIKRVPIVNIFTIRKSDLHYKIYVKSVINPDNLKSKQEYIKYAADLYIKDLEEILKKYPEQWFNFYKFWNMENFYGKDSSNNRGK